MNLADMRLSYTQAGLLESDVHPDPVVQFEVWFSQALAVKLPEPNAMALATVTPDGAPNVRMVLLKSFDSAGFAFFTNYESRKAQELSANQNAAILFYWHGLERQVRITGQVEKLSAAESDAYFQSRPRGHQLGAWASQQSAVVVSREALEHSLSEAERQFGDGPIPLPPFWGGYRLRPRSFEFWQGRPNRLHDRIEFTKDAEGLWRIRRLSP